VAVEVHDCDLWQNQMPVVDLPLRMAMLLPVRGFSSYGSGGNGAAVGLLQYLSKPF